MTTAPNYLVPTTGGSPVLAAAVAELFNMHNVTTCSALTLRTQPAFNNDLLPTLPEDQALAAAHAAEFQNGWGFGVANTYLSGLSSLTGFVLNMLTGDMKNIAAYLDATNPQDAAYAQKLRDLRNLLRSLADTCCEIGPDSGSILLRMQSMREQLANLAQDIDDDDTRLRTALVEVRDSDIIVKLEGQLRGMQDQFAALNSQLAKGASTTIAQDLEFGFSFGAVFLEGVTPGAVAGATMSVIGEVDAIGQFNEQTADLQDQRDQLVTQMAALATTIAEDKSEAMELSLVAAQVGVFNAGIKTLLASTSGILDQMVSWKTALGLLADHAGPPSPNFYTNQITAGMFFWSSLKSKLDRYAGILALSKTSSTNLTGQASLAR